MSQERTLARQCAVQALYQWQVSGNTLAEIERQFVEELQTARVLHHRYLHREDLTAYERDMLEELLEKYSSTPEDAEFSDTEPALTEQVRHCAGLGLDIAYFGELLHQIPQNLDVIDAAVGEYADRPVAAIDPVERAILRIGAYELLYRPELPYRVVLNESINLARQFGAAQSHKYVNGILDRVARKHRAAEAGAKRGT